MICMPVKIKLLEGGKMPVYKHTGDACADAFANENAIILPGSRQLISLGICGAIPEGYQIVIRPRSGNTKNGIDIGIGTWDSEYRGEVKACVINSSKEPYEIKRGERICQLNLEPVYQAIFEEVSELDETDRGEGFGSSGRF